MERQIHGFSFERKMIEKYNLIKRTKYTDEWDADFKEYPVSIKTHEIKGGIELGDIYRISRIDKPFFLIVGFWKDNAENIVEEHIAFIEDVEKWKSLFNYDLLNDFKDFLNSITNSSSDDEKWKKGRISLTEKWKNTTPNIIKPRWKRDHKKQKRIQCAISYVDFIKYFDFVEEL